MAVTTPLLSVRDLAVDFRQAGRVTHAVRGVSFDIRKGETVALVGESGSGKSVTALSILKLLPYPSAEHPSGEIWFKGENLIDEDERDLRRVRGNDVTMVFQEPMSSLNPLHTVERQIGEILKIHQGMSDSAARKRVIELLTQVGIRDPETRLASYPHQLSGGQRQRVMIAMALANNPRLLIADEPTTALDVTTQRQILDLIKRLQAERGMGVLFITHDIGVVADIADRVVVLRQGEVVEQGAAPSVLQTPREDYTRMLLDAVPGRGEAHAGSSRAAPILEVQALDKVFVSRQGLFAPPRRVTAADKLNFVLRKGDTLAVVGESGSGKSTLARMILRLIEPDAGAILWQGGNVRTIDRSALRQFRRRAQIVFQDPYASLDPRVKVGVSILRGPVAFGMPRGEAETLARRWLERVGLGAQAFDRFPHEFSGGQRQRICIARALALEPELLIADEAVSALDVSVQAQVLDLLAGLKAEMGLSMLFITHDLRVARDIADQVIVMQEGRIVEQNDTAALFDAPRDPYTRRLLDAVPGRAFFASRVAAGGNAEGATA